MIFHAAKGVRNIKRTLNRKKLDKQIWLNFSEKANKIYPSKDN